MVRFLSTRFLSALSVLVAFVLLIPAGLMGQDPFGVAPAKDTPAAAGSEVDEEVESETELSEREQEAQLGKYETGFYGRIFEVDLKYNVVLVQGEPLNNVKPGQSYEVVLGDAVYGKLKVTYVGEYNFEAQVIEGNIKEIHRIHNGRSNTIDMQAGFKQFVIVEPLGQQFIACKMKDFSTRRFTVVGQNANGFAVRGETGRVEVVPYYSIKRVVYKEEQDYDKMVDAPPEADVNLPGYLARKAEEKRLAQMEQDYKRNIILAKRYLMAKNYKQTIAYSAAAAKLFPKRYVPYYYQGEAYYAQANYRYSAAMYEQSLKVEPKPKEVADIQLNLAQSYYKLNYIKGSEYYLKRAIQNGKKGYEPQFLMARISKQLGKFNNSLNYGLAALKDKQMPPNEEAQVRYLVADVYHNNQGDTEAAWDNINKAKTIEPKDEKIVKLHKELMLARMKEAQAEVQLERLGGTWISPDKKLYMHFFEESAMILFVSPTPDGKAKAIIVGGDLVMDDDGTVTITEAKDQRLPMKKFRVINKAQITALHEHMFSGSDEFDDVDDIVFRVKHFDYQNFELMLDGKLWKMTPVQ